MGNVVACVPPGVTDAPTPAEKLRAGEMYVVADHRNGSHQQMQGVLTVSSKGWRIASEDGRFFVDFKSSNVSHVYKKDGVMFVELHLPGQVAS